MAAFRRNTFNIPTLPGVEGGSNLINILVGNGDPGGRLALQGQLLGGRLANQRSRGRNLNLRGDQLELELQDARGLRERNPAGTPRGDSIRNPRSADTERGLGLRADNEAKAAARDLLGKNDPVFNIGGQKVPLSILSELFPGGGIKSLAETDPSIANINNQVESRNKKTDATVSALEALGLNRESGAKLNEVRGGAIKQGAGDKTRLTDSQIDVNKNRIDLLTEHTLTQKQKTKYQEFKNSVQKFNQELGAKKTQKQIDEIDSRIKVNLQKEGLTKKNIEISMKKLEQWTRLLADDADFREIYGFGADTSKDLAMIGKTKALMGLAMAKTEEVGKTKGLTGTGRMAAIASIIKQSITENITISEENGEKIKARHLSLDELSSHVANIIDGMSKKEIEDIAAKSDAADANAALGLDVTESDPLTAPDATFDAGGSDLINQLLDPGPAVTGNVSPAPPPEPSILEQAHPELSEQPALAPSPVPAAAPVIQPDPKPVEEITPDIKLNESALLMAEKIFQTKGIDGLIKLADDLDKRGRTKELREVLKLIQLKRSTANAGVP